MNKYEIFDLIKKHDLHDFTVKNVLEMDSQINTTNIHKKMNSLVQAGVLTKTFKRMANSTHSAVHYTVVKK